MAPVRKPTWEELKQSGVLQWTYKGYIISQERVLNLLDYLFEHGCHRHDEHHDLLEKPFLTEKEYEAIQISHMVCDSKTERDNDGVSKEMKDRIIRKRTNTRR